MISILMYFFFHQGGLFANAADFKIIVKKDSPAQSLDISKIKSVFIGDLLYLTDGTSLSPAVYASTQDISREIIQTVSELDYRAYTSLWRRKLFSGRGFPPKEIHQKEYLLDFLVQKEGAIGVVPLDFVVDKTKFSELK